DGGVESLDLDPLDHRDGLHDELRDAVTSMDRELVLGIRVDEEHLELAPVERIDQTRRVEARDAVLQRKSGTGEHEAGVTRGERDRDARRHDRAAAVWRERDLLARVQVVAGVVGVLLLRERQLAVEPDDADVHRGSLAGGRPSPRNLPLALRNRRAMIRT